MNAIKKFWADETGLEMSEYAIAAGIVIAAGVALWTTLGGQIKAQINKLIEAMGGTAVS